MAGIYWNEEEGIISISNNGEDWYTIADKNLGATVAWSSGDSLTADNCGLFYQWGNNYGFPRSGATNTSGTKVDASNYGPNNYYSSSTFIMTYYDDGRDSTQNNDLWGDITDTLVARRGPCNEGFHVPTVDEMNYLIYDVLTTMGIYHHSAYSNATELCSLLKLPRDNFLNYGSGQYMDSWIHAYWLSNSSTYSGEGGKAFALKFRYNDEGTSLLTAERYPKSLGAHVRPYKNDPVIPYANEGWDILYGDDLPDRPTPPPPPPPKLKRIVKHNNYYFFGEKPTHASGITLNKSSITLNTAGQTEQLIATITPEDAVNKKVLWSSSNTSIATVSSTGLVTCVTPGECTITATCADGGASTSCSVLKPISVKLLLIGGGGGGAGGCYTTSGVGGGGAGGVIECDNYSILKGDYNVVLGQGGLGGCYGGNTGGTGCQGGDSCLGELVACGGGGGGMNVEKGADGGSGGGGGWSYCAGGSGVSGQGYSGGAGGDYAGGGGGGAGGAGQSGGWCPTNICIGGYGGEGIMSSISGTSKCYAGGGGGASGGQGKYGGGNAGGHGTTYGSGGGGVGGKGQQGILILSYPISCGYNISGGVEYCCDGNKIHCFIKDDILSVDGSCTLLDGIEFLLVGGGGSGGTGGSAYVGGGGGGGSVIEISGYNLSSGTHSIVIGAAGSNGCKGGDSCFGSLIAYGGGQGGNNGSNGGDGGNGGGGGCRCGGGQTFSVGGYTGGRGGGEYGAGGGAGAGGNGCNAVDQYTGGAGGCGITSCITGSIGYYGGGGGGGGGGTTWHDGCGSGGAGSNYNAYNAGRGGVFVLRYPTSCGYNITGGNKYTCGDYTIHIFTSSGTLTVN